jgi:multiple sugar transport system permease protein
LLRMNEGIRMAATVICIVPLVLLYFVVERKLIESIDRAGITGE